MLFTFSQFLHFFLPPKIAHWSFPSIPFRPSVHLPPFDPPFSDLPFIFIFSFPPPPPLQFPPHLPPTLPHHPFHLAFVIPLTLFFADTVIKIENNFGKYRVQSHRGKITFIDYAPHFFARFLQLFPRKFPHCPLIASLPYFVIPIFSVSSFLSFYCTLH